MNSRMKITFIVATVLSLFLIFQKMFLDDDSLSVWNLPLAGKIIMIDPGHGGPDGGAGDKTLWEKDIALNVSFMLRDYLQQQGALVLMTRESDVDLADDKTRGLSRRKTEDLHKRLKIINDSEADLLVSIHLNAIPSPRWRGAQTFYAPQYEENARVSKFIQDELRRNLENTTRKAKPINHVFILKNAKMASSLVEIGFLSNAEERQLLQQEDYQQKIAASIYEGISRFFTNEAELAE